MQNCFLTSTYKWWHTNTQRCHTHMIIIMIKKTNKICKRMHECFPKTVARNQTYLKSHTNQTCHCYCQWHGIWGGWLRNLLWLSLLPVPPICLLWPSPFSHYIPMELSWSWPYEGRAGGREALPPSLTNLIVPHFLSINGTRCGTAPPNVPISIICLH